MAIPLNLEIQSRGLPMQIQQIRTGLLGLALGLRLAVFLQKLMTLVTLALIVDSVVAKTVVTKV